MWDWNARTGTDYRKMTSDYGIRDVDKIVLPRRNDLSAHRAEDYRRPRRPYTLTPFDCVGTYTFPFATTGGANFVKSPRASRAVFISEL